MGAFVVVVAKYATGIFFNALSLREVRVLSK